MHFYFYYDFLWFNVTRGNQILCKYTPLDITFGHYCKAVVSFCFFRFVAVRVPLTGLTLM